MALIVKSSRAGFDTVSAQHAQQLAGELVAGAAIDILAPCYINADGKVYMTDATAANAAAEVDGWAATTYAAGDPVTLLGQGVIVKYSDGNLTPGAIYFAAATAGRLDDAATTGDASGSARAYNANDLYFLRGI